MALLRFSQAGCLLVLMFMGSPICCQEKSGCGRPPSVENADHDGTKAIYNHGQRVNYNCLQGYYRYGYPFKVCNNGAWYQPVAMVCKKKSCGHPGDVLNGGFDSYLFTVGASVRFTCDEGFELRGDVTRLCLVTGQWSGEVPSCQRVQCPRLSAPVNGEIIGKDFRYEDTVTVRCKEGYLQNGSSHRSCQSNRQWTGDDTTCNEITCEKLELENGQVIVKEPIKYGTLATFRCDKGKRLIGRETSACIDMNQWTHAVPRCAATCPVPEIENGFVNKKISWGRYRKVDRRTIKDNQAVYIFCNTNYELSSGGTSKKLKCVDGELGNIPTCTAKSCTKTPKDIEGGQTTIKGMGHLDVVTYSCNPGYKLIGVKERTCWFGRWEYSPPKCEQLFCTEMSLAGYKIDMEKGQLSYKGYSHGTLLSLTCDEGYQTRGSLKKEHRECSNSTWVRKSVNGVDCTPAPCDPLEDWTTQTLEYNQKTIKGKLPNGTSVQFICGKGYSLSSFQDKSTCLKGKWSSPRPTCNEGNCEIPSTHLNGYIRWTGRKPGDQVEYICNEGYTIRGDHIRTCTNAEWTGSKPTCVEDTCQLNLSPAEEIDNDQEFYQHNTKITMKCKFSHHIEKQEDATCERGQWKPARPICIPDGCTQLENEDSNGEIKYTLPDDKGIGNEIVNGSVAFLLCNRGYQLSGHILNRTCLYGNWQPVIELGSCVHASCEYFNAGETKLVPHGGHVNLTCADGFHSIGWFQTNISVKCDKGHWTPFPPVCYPDDCELPTVRNALFCDADMECIKRERILHNSTVTVQCRAGYYMENNEHNSLSCQTGKLSGIVSNCTTDGKSCTNPGGVLNANRTSSWPAIDEMFSPSTSLNYTCWSGHLIDKIESWRVITCLSDGFWNEKLPECKVITCSRPDSPRNGDIFPKNETFKLNETVEFSCDEGYIMSGYRKMTCTDSGFWDFWPPDCLKERGCPKPSEPENGRVTLSQEEPKYKSAIFQCYAGFALNGSSELKCLTSGNWSNEYPTCIKADPCSDPPEVENTILVTNKADYLVGDSVRYECKEGYVESTYMSVTCNNLQQWNTTAIKCARNVCSLPEVGPNLRIVYRTKDGKEINPISEAEAGTIMLSRCERFNFHYFEGDSSRTCEKGFWTGKAPKCTLVLHFGSVPAVSVYIYKDAKPREPILRSDDGKLLIKTGVTFTMRCSSRFHVVWETSSAFYCDNQTACKKTSVYSSRSFFSTVMGINPADQVHTNTYHCRVKNTPEISVDFQVEILP